MILVRNVLGRITSALLELTGAGLVGADASGTTVYPAGTVGAWLASWGGRVAAEVAAGVTPSDYAYPPLDIRRYGAVGDGVTNCDAAWTAAQRVSLCWTTVNPVNPFVERVYIPAGTWLITINNPFGQVDFTTLPNGSMVVAGWGVRGAGLGSIIRWRPTGAAARWLYDGGTASPCKNALAHPMFSDFSIYCDPTGLSAGGTLNGFRVFGYSGGGVSGLAQNFKFHNFIAKIYDWDPALTLADIAKAGTFMQTLGTQNADSMHWNQCGLYGWGTILDQNASANNLCHSFVSTNLEVIFGDVFKVAGGSNIQVYGGSIILYSSAEAYFIRFTPGAISLVGTYTFDGIRFELNSNVGNTATHSRIIKYDATGVPTAYTDEPFTVNFRSVNFYPASTTVRDTIVLDAASRMVVNFEACEGFDLPYHTARFTGSKAGIRNANSVTGTEVTFSDGSAIGYDKWTFADANSIGRVSVRDCRNTLDYDLKQGGILADTAGGRNVPLKTATLYGQYWPDAGAAPNPVWQIQLPPNALIKAMRFRKQANAGAATAGYQLAMTNNAVVVYPGVQSTIAAQNALHEASVDNLNIGTGALGAVNNYVNLVAVAGHTGSAQAVPMAAGDYAMVDYW